MERCAGCGADLPEGAERFCAACGAPLGTGGGEGETVPAAGTSANLPGSLYLGRRIGRRARFALWAFLAVLVLAAIGVGVHYLVTGAGGDSGGEATTEGVGLYPIQIEDADGDDSDGNTVTGYIDRTGAVVIPPRFDFGGSFHDGLAQVVLDGQAGYIDQTGAVVVQPPEGVFVTGLGDFSEGLATALSLDYKIGYIDKTGAMVIEPQFKTACAFSEGRARASLDGRKWGYIDKTGAWVVEPRFDEVGSFSEGRAPVRQVFGTSSGRWGYIDKSGACAIEQQFELAGSFSEGLALAEALVEAVGEEHPASMCGYVDKRGEWAIEPQFVRGAPFGGGLAAAAVLNEAFDAQGASGDHDEDGDPRLLFGYINKEGVWAIEPRFEAAEAFAG